MYKSTQYLTPVIHNLSHRPPTQQNSVVMETLNFTLGLGDPFTNGTSSCTFAQDPDISGIGVRISF